MEPIIRIEHLGKMYILRHAGVFPNYDTLKETLRERAKEFGRRLLLHPQLQPATQEEFWALRDINLEVGQGERVGIIGPNGAGKSTLLKILSRIIEPTTGSATISGRLASLLDIGTGFHPELTGRENIFMNGTILGMSRREIIRKFDEIVAFAELEKFIDLAVKCYSSGMYLRLAFAVAAHLESEILLVDEVLAVGDIHFQKRCLDCMQQLAHEGRTILFVSHNMAVVESFCTKTVFIEQGEIRKISQADGSPFKYPFPLNGAFTHTCSWKNQTNQLQHTTFTPTELYLADQNGKKLTLPITNAENIWIYIRAEVQVPDSDLQIGYILYTENNTVVYWSSSNDTPENRWPQLTPGIITLRSCIPAHTLNEGTYRIELIAALYFRQWLIRPGEPKMPQIEFCIRGGLSDSRCWTKKRPGILAPIFNWEKVDL